MRRLFGYFILLPILVVGLSGLLWLHSSLPPQERSWIVHGIAGPIKVTRDNVGVPTITAVNDSDAAFALGYVHAEDRLFQMDLQRHYGGGRLAEWFGPQAVGTDRMMRTLGLARAAGRQLAILPPEIQAALTAYAAGVNAYITDRRWALPPEYYLLRAEPEPWQPTDSLLWGKLMAWQLAGNYRSELVRAQIATRIKPEEMSILYPEYPKDAPTVLGDLVPIYNALPIGDLLALTPMVEDPPRASNNWVVGGAHTVSGKPLLANDPHLELSAPGVWYLARIVTAEHTIEGGTIAGAPIVLVGHNERIAWGATNTGSDVSDLFVEQLDPTDSTKYLTPDGAQPFVTRREIIEVRGAPPVELTVRETRHGPVLSDVTGPAQQIADPGYVLALQASYLMDGDRTPQAFWELNRAGDWASFTRALATYGAPQQNFVYADVDGHIGFAAPGRVPTRAKGDGWLPMPGWTGDYDWTGFVPVESLPQTLDPPSGRIVTANNKIVPDSYAYFLGRDWDEPFRAQRIQALIDQRPQSLDTAAAIQRDIYSPMAERLLPLMLEIAPGSVQARLALDRLQRWDRRMDRDKAEPLIFTAWLREFNRIVFADKLAGAFDDYWSLHPRAVESVLTAHPDWCDDRTTVVVETCPEQLGIALARALDDLTSAYGTDMDGWRWGRAHAAEFDHPVLSRLPVLKSEFALSLPTDGGVDTINRGASVVRNSAQPYRDVLGPALRMAVDMADIEHARFMVVPGQSGNPLSPHYADLLQPWRDGYMLLIDSAYHATTETFEPP